MKQIEQRLKQYRKRLKKHISKKQDAERNGKTATARTVAAIENNRKWVEHYSSLLDKMKNTRIIE